MTSEHLPKNTYRKDLSWLHYNNAPKVQGKLQYYKGQYLQGSNIKNLNYYSLSFLNMQTTGSLPCVSVK